MLRLLLILLLAQSSPGCPHLDEKYATRRRLPTTIRPLSYSITVEPELRSDFQPASFRGSIIIRVIPIIRSINITLHASRLRIYDDSVCVVDAFGIVMDIGYMSRDEQNEFYIITMKEELSKGKVYRVVIGSYLGLLQLYDVGFYLATYAEDGIERRFVATQFESTFARRAFPCFDEPEFKATFNITIIRPTDYSSVSNEALLETIHLGNGLSKDVYTQTACMSTYLVAFVISQYDCIEKDAQRVFARPQAVRDGWCDYALETGLEIRKALEDYLGIEYSLSKLDQVAIPDLYSSGAMENWGLLTYRESYLLFSGDYSTSQQLQKICTVIAHEHAHQWFGNLVTLQWWKHAWLNEGFATYFEFFAAHIIEPRWRLMEQFVFSVHDAMQYDSENCTTPMDFEGPFDTGAPSLIAYDKSASILRMVEHFATQEVYREALNVYLTRRGFSTGTPADVYLALQTGVDNADVAHLLGGHRVSEVLSPWVQQEGYPVVTVSRNYNTGTIGLHQRRFLMKSYRGASARRVWPVPINFMFSSRDRFDFSRTTADFWFDTATTRLSGNFTLEGFVMANKQQTGFYRVNYDLKNWYRIIHHLTTSCVSDIPPINRAQLINDAFNLAKAGLLSNIVALDLSTYVCRETDYIPIMAFLEEMEDLRRRMARSHGEALLNEHVLRQLRTVARKLTFYDKPRDDHVAKLNRVAVMTQICSLGDSGCRTRSADALRRWRRNSILSPDMQEYVFCCALRNGTGGDWNYVYARYLRENVEVLKLRLLMALGCIENENVLIDYMNKIVDDTSPIRKTDRQIAFESIYNSGTFGLNITLIYIHACFKLIKESSLNVDRIISDIANRLHTPDGRLMIKEFSQRHGYKYFDSALKTVEENVEWNKRFAPGIQKWLRTQKQFWNAVQKENHKNHKSNAIVQ